MSCSPKRWDAELDQHRTVSTGGLVELCRLTHSPGLPKLLLVQIWEMPSMDVWTGEE